MKVSIVSVVFFSIFSTSVIASTVAVNINALEHMRGSEHSQGSFDTEEITRTSNRKNLNLFDTPKVKGFAPRAGFNIFEHRSINAGHHGFRGLAIASAQVSSVPVPASIWLFISGVIGLFGIVRRRKA